MKHLSRLLLLSATLGLASCESSTSVVNNPPVVAHDTITSSDRVLFVANEGQFGVNNSSVDAVIFRRSLHVHDSGTVHDTTFSNDTIFHRGVLASLGEANDLLIAGKTLIVLDNAGNSVHFVDADSLKQTATMPLGLSQPNKMALVGMNQIIVTERGDSVIPIIDVASRTVVNTIKVGIANAAVGVLDGNVFVTISKFQKPGQVVITNAANTAIQSSLAVASGPETLLVDSAHDQVIIACSGDYLTVPPTIYFVDGKTLKIKDSIPFGNIGDPVQCVLGDKLYAINGGTVTAIDAGSQTIEGPVITATGKTAYYNGSYNAGSLYLGISDFTSPTGKVNVFDATTHTFRWGFQTGIAPAHFAFYH